MISVGVDVSKGKSTVCILKPYGEVVSSPFEIHHVEKDMENPKYYLPEEISDTIYGRMIRIIGGPFEGYEGRLLTTRCSKVKRLLVELPNFFSVGVEVNPDLIEII